MTRRTASTIYGNLDLLILHTLRVSGPAHGLGIIDAITERSGGLIQVEDGALYHALHRLEIHALLEGEWRISGNNRRARFYILTAAGERELTRAQNEWARHAHAVSLVLGLGGELP